MIYRDEIKGGEQRIFARLQKIRGWIPVREGLPWSGIERMEGVEEFYSRMLFLVARFTLRFQTFHDAGGQLLFRLEVVHRSKAGRLRNRPRQLRDRRESRTRGAGAPLFQYHSPTRTAVAPELAGKLL